MKALAQLAHQLLATGHTELAVVEEPLTEDVQLL
jgi:hypothetical protein